ncbi:MAG: bifunctional diguanylate cyclase/phosphodiesterase [Chloroflexota bacterium]|nr:bifunctional diguanylate cyclase/phosphodiesterase [Chloroflexota bacterium]MDE3192079.1 bifunctional diguanylate cyclase/phosphodiesterase [Chloroflexota bacterium]
MVGLNDAVARASSVFQLVVQQHSPRATALRARPGPLTSRLLVVAAGVAFLVAFPLVDRLIGDDAIHLAVIPIAAAAVLLGLRAGLAVTAVAFAAEEAMSAVGVTSGPINTTDLSTAVFVSLALAVALARVNTLVTELRVEVAARAEAEQARALALEDLRRQTSYDGLTGIPTRVELERELEGLMREAPPPGAELAAVALNIAEFHEFNDTFGYGAGDLLLERIPSRLERVVAMPAVLGRIGGDEFCLATFVPIGDGPVLGRRVLDALALPFGIDGVRVAVTGSTGVAVARADERAAELLRRVTIALSSARAAGRTSVVYSDSLAHSSPERLALVADLQEAIEGDHIGVVFQPQVDPATGRFVGAEALARWTHPTRGVIAPDEFVRLAERTGLIGGLTDRILEAAVREWGLGRDGARVAVNVSTLDLTDATLPERVTSLLAAHGLPGDRFTVEVTESVVARDMAAIVPVLREFREARIHVSVDDFGTGYSSLAYLDDLPIDEVKLDRSFVRRAAGDPRARAILRATIGLACDLGLHTVAEGVEDRLTYDLIASIGCSAVQGYLVSPPLAAAELREWLARR